MKRLIQVEWVRRFLGNKNGIHEYHGKIKLAYFECILLNYFHPTKISGIEYFNTYHY